MCRNFPISIENSNNVNLFDNVTQNYFVIKNGMKNWVCIIIGSFYPSNSLDLI